MSMTLGEAVLELRTGQKQYDKGLSSAKTKALNLSKSFTSIGKKLTLGLTAPLIAFAAFGVKMASDLGESMNKAKEVFGEAVAVVTDFADTSASKFGISEQAAFDYAGTLGLILNASGLTEKASSDMSIEMVKLAADMASFANIPIDVALQKIRSGLVGEVEPLRTVGVLLNAAAVEAKAVNLGLVEQGEELTEAAKVQARYALIMDQTITMQGDFQRTSDTLANSLRIAKAEIVDMSGDLLQSLIPTIIKTIQVVRKAVNWFSDLPEKAKTMIVVAGALTAALGPLFLALGGIVKVIAVLAPALIALATGPAAPFVLLAAAAAALAFLIATHWKEIKTFTLSLVDDITDFFKTLHRNIMTAASDIVDAVAEIYAGIKQWLVDKLTALISPITTAWNAIVNLFQTGADQVDQSTNEISDQAKSGMQHGGIISTPSLVLSGAGAVARIAEAGPEGVLPLARTMSGDLGVKAVGGGGGGDTIIQIPINIADSVITSQEAARKLLIPVIEEASEMIRTTIVTKE